MLTFVSRAMKLPGMAKFPKLWGTDHEAGPDLISGLKDSAGNVPAPRVRSGGGLARLLGGTAVNSTGSGVIADRPGTPPRPAAAAGTEPKPARLAFMIDATASRKRAWQQAKNTQIRMFQEASRFGRLALRMVHFQGTSTVEAFPATWTQDPHDLVRHMERIVCRHGHTKIVSALRELLTSADPPSAIVAIGDCCEEDLASIERIAHDLGRRGIPVFSFLDGNDDEGRCAYRALASLSGGAFFMFGEDLRLDSLVVAAGAYAAGGTSALTQLAASRGPERRAAAAIAGQLLLSRPMWQ